MVATQPSVCRRLKVAAGQADGIQPRTIEVLQASQNFFPPSMRSLTDMQSYGLAERLLSQAASMVMAVSENALSSVLTPYTQSSAGFLQSLSKWN
jgi:hypothetical protein